ncbi:hypothetical protein GGP41_010647 [Bipolaris sorokiniana]|uniref:Rhodopsin domain-containing protein n=1 Tax=Cochliobolus sativus TaxID=45130 RepID=A0A8H5ZMS6_COCSA|nr:hypothetical protein GGP41_010647 [Bipolaris sorokiniana]
MSAPGPPVGADLTADIVIPMTIFFALGLVTSVARIWSRIWPEWVLRWDDYTLIFGLLLVIAWHILTSILIARGYAVVGVPQVPERDVPIQVALGMLIWWGYCILRISMALMLLRFHDTRMWRWSLIALVVVQVCEIVVVTGFNMSYCRPLSAIWHPTPDSRCMSGAVMMTQTYVSSALNILADFFLATAPLAIIARLKRPLVEKVLLAGLMTTGLCATMFAVLRVALTQNDHRIPLRTETHRLVLFALLSVLELSLLLIGCNLPCLKGPTHRLLLKWGIVKPARHAAEVNASSFLDRMSHGRHFAQQLDNMSLQEWGGDQSTRNEGVGSQGSLVAKVPTKKSIA